MDKEKEIVSEMDYTSLTFLAHQELDVGGVGAVIDNILDEVEPHMRLF